MFTFKTIFFIIASLKVIAKFGDVGKSIDFLLRYAHWNIRMLFQLFLLFFALHPHTQQRRHTTNNRQGKQQKKIYIKY